MSSGDSFPCENERRGEPAAATLRDDEDEWDDEAACTHCGGEGICEAGCDPGWYDDIHACHACNGTGNRKDQVIF